MKSTLPADLSRHRPPTGWRGWQSQHRHLFAIDRTYRAHVYACMVVWFLVCFLPLVYFALSPDAWLRLSPAFPRVKPLGILLFIVTFLFLHYSRQRAMKRHSKA